MIQVELSELREYVDTLKSDKESFEVMVTGTSARIVHGEDKYLFSSNPIPLKYLALIKKVKKHVEKLDLQPPFYNSESKAYRALLLEDCSRPFISDNGYEIDVTSFYTVAAYKLGYFNIDILNELLAIPKKFKIVRQVAFGSLAKHEICQRYENGVIVERWKNYRPELATAFYHVCQYCNDIALNAASSQKGIVCYWVDNFVTIGYPKSVSNFMTSAGFSCTVDKLKSLAFDPLNRYVSRTYEDGTSKGFSFGAGVFSDSIVTEEYARSIMANIERLSKLV